MENTNLLKRNLLKNSYQISLSFALLIFQFFGFALSIIRNSDVDEAMLLYILGFVIVSQLSNRILNKLVKGDGTLIFLVNLLFSVSVITMLRLDAHTAKMHIIWYFIGLIIYTITYFIYKYLDRFFQRGFWVLAGITFLTFVITLVLGRTIYGARNWIIIGPISIQLSEFAKISYILMIAAYYHNIEEYRKLKFGEYYLLGISYLFSLLFFIQGELGTAIVFVALMISNMFIFTRKYTLIILNIILALIGIYLASFVLSHIKVRIDIWLNPWADFNNRGYQVIQGLFSIANGGFFGKGIGLGNPLLVPVVASDYILAGIIEELGMFMGFAIILVYILIFYKSIKISLQFNSNYYSSASMSIGLIYSFQALIMFGGILKLIPLTGITTPFLSYGGSSTMANFMMLAILQFISTKIGENYEQFKE